MFFVMSFVMLPDVFFVLSSVHVQLGQQRCVQTPCAAEYLTAGRIAAEVLALQAAIARPKVA